MNDLIKEQLFENFTVFISNVFPESSGLTINFGFHHSSGYKMMNVSQGSI